MNGNTTERISQDGQRPQKKEHDLLARASAFAKGVLGSIQALAGTTTCKGVQIARLRQCTKHLFIDTIIFTSDTDGLDTYKKYSPNYPK